MATTIYSHAFLVGSYNGDLIINHNDWKSEIISPNGNNRYKEDRGYNGICGLFYKAHIDAMLEADALVQKERPDFLKDVHHYYAVVDEKNQNVVFKAIKDGYDYKMKILKLHIFTFPLRISLFAIEIDDSENELNALTIGHFTLTRWAWEWDKNIIDEKEALNSALQPLKNLMPENDLKNLITDGNKLKLFQSIQYETEEPDDKLLYEIGTSSPIGCIDNYQDRYSPATDYWQQIVNANSVSTFRNWKALALMDSFTMLGSVGSFDIDDSNFLYFPLIYIRCVFEKTFCFSRNNAYREDKADLKSLPIEIEKMEKYYFYDNISYNFQPNLLYKAMAKGLGLNEERVELSKQVKETTKKKRDEQKENEEKRFNNILAGVSIFAVISVIWDFCSIVKDASGIDSNHNVPTFAQFFIAIGFILIVLLWRQIYKRKDDENNKNIP